LARSSNVGVSRIFDRLGGPRLTRWFSAFHLNQPAQPRAAKGTLHQLDEASAKTMYGAVTALGFGAKVSLLNLASMYATFANAGVYNAPTLATQQAPRPERLLTPNTAHRVLRMLEAVVATGTGQAARLEGVRVAGKTGTAGPGDNGETQAVSYFIGIVPVDTPRFVIAIMVLDAQGETGGGRVAAPAFARIARKLL